MTTSIFHGIKTNLLQSTSLTITLPATSIIGLVATGNDADADTFPLDTPVLISDVRSALAKAGTTGTLPTALAAIADQCNPTIIVVRVATAVGDASQDDLVAGTFSAGRYTGAKALLMAETVTGFRPRIIGAPGLATHAVTQALIPIAQQLRGMIYALAVGSTVADVATYAATYSARELMLLWPETSVGNGDMEARALGLRAQIDQTTGWQKSLSNVPVNGISALAHDVSWSLDGSSSDATLLNDANVTTIIGRSGFRFWGNRTTSAIPKYAFEVATRTSQALADAIEDAGFVNTDKPLTAALIKDMLEDVNAKFRALSTPGANQRIIGATAWFDPAANASADLANGQCVIDYDFTPCAPLEGLTLNQRITDRYYTDFASQLQTISTAA